ncbi:hypothetical protein [Vibrio crassostreae]|uniref:hypothetical protein n=1 Tax=Vibrio crassostreae TaxID=246167 RepID=UPI00104F3011|nr:hypothetical protein [Vibrio crassostreae]TCT62844.1 hypothetical protein EDB31_13558 [Vibrio crassostreae]
MQYETDPKGLSWPIKPSLIIDDIAAGIVNVSLSPEVPLSTFPLKQPFENMTFKGEAKEKWIEVLRDIADELEKQG